MDKLFKIGLLVLGFGFLAYFFGVGSNVDTADAYGTNQVGRYRFHFGGGVVNVMDTTNADVYLLTNQNDIGRWAKFNPITGKKSIISIKKIK